MPIERSPEFERINRLYQKGKINEAGLDKAVALGLITAEEKIIIIETNENLNV